MRTDWVSPSAATLVIGAFALVLGTALNPTASSETAGQTLRVITENDGRLLAMAVFYFVSALGLMLGLPSLLSVFAKRGWRVGLAGVMVFSVGVLGTAGFAMLLVFFRALALEGAVTSGGLNELAGDLGLSLFVWGWMAGFYGGLILIAVALFVSKATRAWVPVLLLAVVVLLPFSETLGNVGPAIQTMFIAVAFTGVAIAAVAGDQQRRGMELAQR